ncbi:hypothetical protein, partial [Cysteiniphilum sp. 6C5]|uniref:hypothetical protein n=2 Tax=Cysteiniphilum TaxID=2056696 RepID=UPI003F842FA0
THEQKKAYKKQYDKTHKLIVKSVRNNAYYPFTSLPNYYHGKKIAKVMNMLNDSDFKQTFVSIFYSYHEEEQRGQFHSAINSIINYNSKNTTTFSRMSEEYLKLNHRLLWKALEESTLKYINAYSVKGRYQIYLGLLTFGDVFSLDCNNPNHAKLTLPHTYKTEVLGSGLEVIDNKYLTITLTPYDSIIKDCQMYQAELLKVKKIFKDSEIEQAYIAKLDNQVLIAKSHAQLMRKVIKVKEAVKDNQSQSEAA